MKARITFLDKRPIFTGFFTLLATVVFGMSLAFATGLTTPAEVMAQVLPPCCAVPTPTPPPPPPPPPPAVVAPEVVPAANVLPPCCTVPEPTPPPPPPPPTMPVSTPPVAASASVPPPTPAPEPPQPAPAPEPPPVPLPPPIVLVVVGCMDSAATNYNPNAISPADCTYPPPPPVLGCTDKTATNYNASATKDDGSCKYPPPPPPPPVQGCTDKTATNYNKDAEKDDGSCKYTPPTPPVLGCTDKTATNYNSSATKDDGSCAYPPPPPPPGGGGGCTSNCGGGGGGGGGGSPSPTVVIAALPHMGAQPLAYLYLSQIPYTGLDLGPVGTIVYWAALACFALAIAYVVLFFVAPRINRSIRAFGVRVSEALNAPAVSAPAPALVQAGEGQTFTDKVVVSEVQEVPEAPVGYSSYEGFKSFGRGGAVSIDDIVKGLSREHAARSAAPTAPVADVEPIFEQVEPIYENIEPIDSVEPVASALVSAPTDVREFAAALVGGDRVAVFAGLRQHVRGGGAPERLVSSVACLVDDVYRSRVDGASCDEAFARLVARLDTPTLEKLIVALSTAIDSSYSDKVAGAKLALTRALTVLGA